LHELNNPSNVGAILRTAEAAGASGVILTKNSADVFSPKSLRGSMGAAFRLRFWTKADFSEVVEVCRQNRIKTVCADIRAAKNHTEIDWREATALIVGSEARGLSPEEIGETDEQIKIPMKTPVESLNAAVACGIVLYEAARQRGF
jgi:TrmH family RNA methyltransferase